jgi:hypothetical protein
MYKGRPLPERTAEPDLIFDLEPPDRAWCCDESGSDIAPHGVKLSLPLPTSHDYPYGPCANVSDQTHNIACKVPPSQSRPVRGTQGPVLKRDFPPGAIFGSRVANMQGKSAAPFKPLRRESYTV